MKAILKTLKTPAAQAVPAVPAAPAVAPLHHVKGMEDIQGSITAVLDLADALRELAKKGPLPPLLAGKAVAVLFEKNSTRTRVSFDVGIQRLGGIATILDAGGSQIARGESMEDTARTLGGYVDAIVYRAKDHASLEAMAQYADVPVINALTDREHPCQVLADLMAIRTHLGHLEGLTLAYVGDGNNMCHSYLLGAPLVGMNIRVAAPAAFAPDPDIVARAQELAAKAGTQLTVTTDPIKAVQEADAVATDTWISMGDEAEEAARLAAFEGFTVDDALMDQAGPDAVFLHCLPGHWGQEATHEVAHGPRSLVFQQAENRMWVQMALLVRLLRR